MLRSQSYKSNSSSGSPECCENSEMDPAAFRVSLEPRTLQRLPELRVEFDDEMVKRLTRFFLGRSFEARSKLLRANLWLSDWSGLEKVAESLEAAASG